MTWANVSWWEEPLHPWSTALHFHYVVRESIPGDEGHSIGDWWRVGDEWCLQLDPLRYALLSNFGGTDEVRTALSWTIRHVYHGRNKGWKETVLQWHTQFATATDAVLATQWQTPFAIDESFSKLPPGYFTWLHFDRALQRYDTSVPEDITVAVEAVVSAFFPHGVVGWISLSNEHVSLLVHCAIPESFDDWTRDEVDDVSTRDDNVIDGTSREAVWLRACLTEMVDMLAADAFLLAKATVGCRVSTMKDIPKGLMSTITTWRSRKLFAQPLRVIVWGDQPWLPLVQGLPDSAVKQFMEVAGLRASGRELTLNEELEETLQGVVAANLNVSEAARLLYLHRNTLLHRIDRIRQQTGYDIRTFQDAFVLWMAQVLRQQHGG